MAILIGVSSVVYTNFVVKRMAKEEYARIELIVKASQLGAEIEDPKALGFLAEIIKSNTTIPVIITDSSEQINADSDFRNLDSASVLDTQFLRRRLSEMKNENPSIPIVSDFAKQKLFYGDSTIITMLKYYPYVQLFIIALFIIVAYLAFSSSRRFEQNQVWVGMSKETAHQLGTPLSSLMAWVAFLKENKDELTDEMVDDIEKDVQRLEMITERFSKVGSRPVLESHNVVAIITRGIHYLQSRVSRNVSLQIHQDADSDAYALISPPLFDWVLENICKNAIDAMEGGGTITFMVRRKGEHILLDIEDNGKGIPSYLHKTIFNPGFTTRKRGWGLGLSLVKRIVESYHDGYITVLKSEVGKGTTFRIKLNAAEEN